MIDQKSELVTNYESRKTVTVKWRNCLGLEPLNRAAHLISGHSLTFLLEDFYSLSGREQRNFVYIARICHACKTTYDLKACHQWVVSEQCEII